jgi:hypothetical protein
LDAVYEKAKVELGKFKKGKLLLDTFFSRSKCYFVYDFEEFESEIEKAMPGIESKLSEMKPKIASQMELRINRLVSQNIEYNIY